MQIPSQKSQELYYEVRAVHSLAARNDAIGVRGGGYIRGINPCKKGSGIMKISSYFKYLYVAA